MRWKNTIRGLWNSFSESITQNWCINRSFDAKKTSLVMLCNFLSFLPWPILYNNLHKKKHRNRRANIQMTKQSIYFLIFRFMARSANASLLFWDIVDVIKLPSRILSSLDSFLHNFLILFEIFIHQFSGISIQWLFEILSIDML